MLSYNDGYFGVGVLKDNTWNYYTLFFCAASNADCPGEARCLKRAGRVQQPQFMQPTQPRSSLSSTTSSKSQCLLCCSVRTHTHP